MSSPYPEPTPLVPRRPAPVQHLQQPVQARLADQRIGDAERSAVCEELSGHYAAGRISDDELDVRVSAAMAARTWGDLRMLVADLPSPGSAGAPAGAPHQGPMVRAVRPWSPLDVLAVVLLIGTVGVALLGALGLLAAGEPGLILVATLTATTAGLGGMALSQVLRRTHHSVVDRAALRAREEQRAPEER